jgi:hypothetical protein
VYVSSSFSFSCDIIILIDRPGNEKTVDRRVYLDSPLSVQVITPKQHDYDLLRAMEIVDRAVQGQSVNAKL